MKVDIRFLRQGLVEAVAPENFDTMTDDEKIKWAQEILENLDDQAILNALADYERPDIHGYFDSVPEVAAIEKDNGSTMIIQTREWEEFAGPDGRNIVK